MRKYQGKYIEGNEHQSEFFEKERWESWDQAFVLLVVLSCLPVTGFRSAEGGKDAFSSISRTSRSIESLLSLLSSS